MRKTFQKMAGFSAAASVALILGMAPAHAQEAEAASSAFSIEGSLSVLSDYRFRGISLNDKDIAVQPSLTLSHESGLYFTLWGSNIAENSGSDIETDFTLGYAKDVGAVSLDVAAVYYVYPGVSSANYVEFLGSAKTAVGPATLGVSLAYAPSQDNIGNQDNFYAALTGELPITGTPLTLTGSFGIEDGAFGDKKKDWSLGVTADVAGFTLGAAYVDTARTGGDPLGKATAVVSISKSF